MARADPARRETFLRSSSARSRARSAFFSNDIVRFFLMGDPRRRHETCDHLRTLDPRRTLDAARYIHTPGDRHRAYRSTDVGCGEAACSARVRCARSTAARAQSGTAPARLTGPSNKARCGIESGTPAPLTAAAQVTPAIRVWRSYHPHRSAAHQAGTPRGLQRPHPAAGAASPRHSATGREPAPRASLPARAKCAVPTVQKLS